MTSTLRSSIGIPCSRFRHVLVMLAVGLVMSGCVSSRVYNDEPHEYLQEVVPIGPDQTGGDLAIIEFDEHGVLWDIEQMKAAMRLIDRRNQEAKNGILVITFVHGWQHDANPARAEGDLAKFRANIAESAAAQHLKGDAGADHVVGVYLGWHGATSRLPIAKELTFWDRRRAAERVASYDMRETLFRIMVTTKQRTHSKCMIVGHSMGGLIVGKTLAPALTTLLLANGPRGTLMPADLVLLANPALDALASWQFVEHMKRSRARAELRSENGDIFEARGPIIVSITSEADDATGVAYPLGRVIENLFMEFRDDHDPGVPNQRYLSTHSEGHVDFLVSHRAWVEDGELRLERVKGAYNDTPFWIVRVSEDICKDHGDLKNPRFGELVQLVSDLNRVYELDVQTWVLTEPIASIEALDSPGE